jgi:hypothetical protein
MKKQSQRDRENRLADMRCPVHGTGLCQIDVDRMECPRRDCHISFLCDGDDIVARMTDSMLIVQRLDMATI